MGGNPDIDNIVETAYAAMTAEDIREVRLANKRVEDAEGELSKAVRHKDETYRLVLYRIFDRVPRDLFEIREAAP
ncbi:hypothetical protein K0U83_01440 [bacterium]|nr:hypothetical protein [bacterium]